MPQEHRGQGKQAPDPNGVPNPRRGGGEGGARLCAQVPALWRRLCQPLVCLPVQTRAELAGARLHGHTHILEARTHLLLALGNVAAAPSGQSRMSDGCKALTPDGSYATAGGVLRLLLVAVS